MKFLKAYKNRKYYTEGSGKYYKNLDSVLDDVHKLASFGIKDLDGKDVTSKHLKKLLLRLNKRWIDQMDDYGLWHEWERMRRSWK